MKSQSSNRANFKDGLSKIWPSLRIILSLLLLIKAFSHIEWSKLSEQLPNIQPSWLIFAGFLLIAGNVLAGIRWGLLMRVAGFMINLRRSIELYFAGSLINQGLPTTLGGDSFRAVIATKSHGDIDTLQNVDFAHAPPRTRKSFYIVGLDRTLGLAGNSLLGAIGLCLGGQVINSWANSVGFILLLIMIIGALGISLFLLFDPTQSFFIKLMSKLGMPDSLKPTLKAWGLPNILFQLPFAIIIHLFTLASFWACLKACGLNAPIESLMIGMPALGLLLMLPISISGWGLRETTLAGVLGLWGLDPALIVLSSILYGLATLVITLIGLPSLLKTRHHRS